MDVLSAVERADMYASAALDEVLSRTLGLTRKQRALATELAYGVLRHRRRLDRAIASLSKRPLKSAHPTVLRAARLAAYQILLMDHIAVPTAIDHAAEVAGAAAGPGAAGFVNAVTRRLASRGEPALPSKNNDPFGFMTGVLSLEDWMAQAMIDRLGPEGAIALAQAINERPPLVLRVNRLMTTRQTVMDRLNELDGVLANPTRWSPDGIVVTGMSDPRRQPLYEAGQYEVQDEGSQLVAMAVDAQPGDLVADICAGAGGKTLALSALSDDRAHILASDQHSGRLRDGMIRATRSGNKLVTWARMDASRPAIEPASFDRVLLDAPCSGLGTLRRHPEAKWRWTAELVEEMASIQRNLLTQALTLVRPGGRLVYAVCTFTRQEGPDQVDWLLANHDDFSLLPPQNAPLASLADPRGDLSLWPHRHGTDGFYMARFVKNG
ncbi:MAG: 16S rRNA (cytosine(967)-C(5))-methyltransferase RsmB [Deltaproteobacteria bacterium]|nr:16S rRNA (cytosine(967)-C(5))-methyltransferase RsmB [Deltaproteobacteria bacterium]